MSVMVSLENKHRFYLNEVSFKLKNERGKCTHEVKYSMNIECNTFF